MPNASPYLHLILTRWVDRRSDREKESAARLENIKLIENTLDEALATYRQKRRGDIVELESMTEADGTRWVERLKRLEKWTEALVPCREELDGVETTLNDTFRLDRWNVKTASLITHFMKRGDRWADRHKILSSDLSEWVAALDGQLQELEKFQADAKASATELLVSRARKQPYLDFMNDQEHVESALGDRLQALRRSATRNLGRLLAGQRSLEQIAARQPAIWEIHRQPLQDAWTPAEENWRRLREEILKDALIFEGGRRRLRTLRETVRSMRCVEDVYKAPEPAWKQILGSFTLK